MIDPVLLLANDLLCALYYLLTCAGSATITLFAMSSTSDSEKGPGGRVGAGRSLLLSSLLLGSLALGGLLKSLLRAGAGVTLSPVTSSEA